MDYYRVRVYHPYLERHFVTLRRSLIVVNIIVELVRPSNHLATYRP
jgi:hypothetical protein